MIHRRQALAGIAALTAATAARPVRAQALDTVKTNGRVDAASLQFDYDVFRELGLIQTPVSVPNSIDMSFADNANRQLGPYRSRS